MARPQHLCRALDWESHMSSCQDEGKQGEREEEAPRELGPCFWERWPGAEPSARRPHLIRPPQPPSELGTVVMSFPQDCRQSQMLRDI